MWIESHQELGRHPKTRKLARMLGVSIPTAIGHLHLLWWWAVDYAPDGALGRFDPADIADATMWEGDPAQLVTALRDAGWLDDTDGGPQIHDWADYAGRLLERRRADTARKRSTRHHPVRRTSAGHPPDIRRTARVTVPYRTIPYRTIPYPPPRLTATATDGSPSFGKHIQKKSGKRQRRQPGGGSAPTTSYAAGYWPPSPEPGRRLSGSATAAGIYHTRPHG